MFADDWERLGLGPTRDLTAIKKAYALRLRHTRPDDDAQAYQALRESYERAQHWARYAPDDGDEDDAVEDAVEDPSPVKAEAQATPAEVHQASEQPTPVHDEPEEAEETDPAFVLPEDETPEALVDRAYHLWRREGPAVLLAAWPAVEAALDRLPLQMRPEASARFADLVISVQGLPEDFVRALATHFSWLGDFRIDRMIGPARAEALRQVLGDLVVPTVNDPQLLHHFADVRVLHRLLQRGSFHAWLHAALLGWPLARLTAEAGSRLLRGMGIEPEDQKRLDGAMETALWWRAGALSLLLFALSVLITGSTDSAVGSTAITVAASVGVLAFTLIVGTRLSALFEGPPPNVLVHKVFEWRGPQAHGSWSGLALMVAACGLLLGASLLARPNDPTWWPWLVGVLLMAAGVMLTWPARPDLGVTAATTWGFLVTCLMQAVNVDGYFWAMVAGTGTVTMCASLIAEGRIVAPAWRRFGLLPLVFAVFALRRVFEDSRSDMNLWMAIVLLPLVPLALAFSRTLRDGYRSALAPMALGAGTLIAVGRAPGQAMPGGAWLMVAWLIATVVVLALQHGATWLDRRLYGQEGDAG